MNPIDRLRWSKSVAKISGGHLPAVVVAACLADMTNSKTGECYPSISFMAEESGLSKKTIMRGVKKLEKLKLLSIERSKRVSNRYRILVPHQSPASPSSVPTLVPDESPGVVPGQSPQPRKSNRERESQGESHPLSLQEVVSKEIRKQAMPSHPTAIQEWIDCLAGVGIPPDDHQENVHAIRWMISEGHKSGLTVQYAKHVQKYANLVRKSIVGAKKQA